MQGPVPTSILAARKPLFHQEPTGQTECGNYVHMQLWLLAFMDGRGLVGVAFPSSLAVYRVNGTLRKNREVSGL